LTPATRRDTQFNHPFERCTEIRRELGRLKTMRNDIEKFVSSLSFIKEFKH